MSYPHYDFEGLWFEIYQKVLRQNEALGESRLDKSQLREVTTAIFIAQTQRGAIRPMVINPFMDSILKLIGDVKERELQMLIYKNVRELLTIKAGDLTNLDPTTN